jgi:putative DNA-invertase from lambdoid prophage Rac
MSKPGQVFTFLEEASVKRGNSAYYENRDWTVVDGSMQSQLLASVFSMASMIELSFIRERTKKGKRKWKG